MKRNNSRIKAMMLVYNYEITKGDVEESLPEIIEDEIGECDETLAFELFNGVISNLEEIDNIISNNLVNYKINRLNYVDRALVRVAVYEMKYLHTPKNIVINEIVELSKKYSEIDDYLSSKFNNRLLDKIASGLLNE